MRNVLLKKDGNNSLVAKLIGFGSFNDSGTEDQAEESTANVIFCLIKLIIHKYHYVVYISIVLKHVWNKYLTISNPIRE